MKCTCMLATLLLFMPGATVGSAQVVERTTGTVTFAGTTTLSGADVDQTDITDFASTGPAVDVSFTKPQLSGTISPARVPADHVPTPAGNGIVPGFFFGFLGLTHRDQRLAPTGVPGGRNFSLEPPDQGLAVGNGFVVEAVNDAIGVFDASTGTRLSRKALSFFFNLPPAVLRNPDNSLTFGPLLSDPRIYFDWDTGHFFVTALEIDTDPVTGRLANGSSVFIAVSQTNVPTGTWDIFQLDVTNDGDAVFGSCPCFGDQPLIGADKFGFFIDTNAFSISTGGFRGTQLYAVSKQSLVGGNPPTVTAVRFHNLTQAEGPAFTIQPATVPPNGSFELGNGGTEYFVSSLDFTSTLDDRLTVWALTNTSSLNAVTDDQGAAANLNLTEKVITTQVYGQSPDAQQKSGLTPLLDALAASGFKNHLELVTSNDDRMQQVVFAAGKLWTALNSVVKTQGVVRTGAAFFILSPSVTGGQVSATVAKQGYVAINSPNQNSVMYPSIGVNPSGRGVIAFSIVGLDFFPSAAFAKVDAVNGAGPIVISGPGALPDDGFTGYAPFGFRSARWGDYSAAVADESGAIWMGNELTPNAPRTLFANWGTFITKVNP